MKTNYEQGHVDTVAVGMGATICHVNDRYPATIVEVKQNGRKIGVKQDLTRHCDSNTTFERNDDAELVYFTFRKNGAYIPEGRAMIHGPRLSIGERSYYINRDI